MSTITAIEIDTTDLAREIAEAEFAERDVFPSLWSLLDGLREARKRGRNARATVLNDRAVAEFVRLKIEDAVIEAIGLEYLDEAITRAMYALGYDGDFEFDGLDEEDMAEEQIARYRRWYQ